MRTASALPDSGGTQKGVRRCRFVRMICPDARFLYGFFAFICFIVQQIERCAEELLKVCTIPALPTTTTVPRLKRHLILCI